MHDVIVGIRVAAEWFGPAEIWTSGTISSIAIQSGLLACLGCKVDYLGSHDFFYSEGVIILNLRKIQACQHDMALFLVLMQHLGEDYVDLMAFLQ